MRTTLSNGAIIRRLLALSWQHRAGCIKAIGLQVILLGLVIGSLSLAGLGIDYIRHQIDPQTSAPRWPWGVPPPASWPPLTVLVMIAGAALLCAGLRAILSRLYGLTVVHLLQRGIVVNLRAQVYDRLQRLSFRFFDANTTGTLINRITGDVQSVRMFIDGVVIQGVVLVTGLVWYLVYMFHIHVTLTLACIAIVPLIALATAQFARRVRPAYERDRVLVDQMILDLSEHVQGISVIKGFAREQEALARLDADNRAVRNQKQSIFWGMSLYNPTVAFFGQIGQFILFGYGGWLVIRGELPLGLGLIVFQGLLHRFAAQVDAIANLTDVIQQSLTAARRVFEILDTPVEIGDAQGSVALPRARGAVCFERVYFAYTPGEPVLNNLDFEIQPGQCVGILGATGAGKSTLLSLIPRFYDPGRGIVRIDGEDVRRIRLDDLRRNVGLVFQQSFLFSNTVAANIAFGCPGATRDQIERAAQIAAAHDFIMELPQGYETVLGEAGVDLSGGQRQRLAIARAMLTDPPILLLDDPTAAVDAETEGEIMAAIESAMRGRTTIIVTHRISVLRRADLILVINRGRVVQHGRHNDLIKIKGRYRRSAWIQLDGLLTGPETLDVELLPPLSEDDQGGGEEAIIHG